MPLEQPVMNHTNGAEDVILFNESRVSMFNYFWSLRVWCLMQIFSGQLYSFRCLYSFSYGLYSDLKDIRYEVHVHIAWFKLKEGYPWIVQWRFRRYKENIYRFRGLWSRLQSTRSSHPIKTRLTEEPWAFEKSFLKVVYWVKFLSSTSSTYPFIFPIDRIFVNEMVYIYHKILPSL